MDAVTDLHSDTDVSQSADFLELEKIVHKLLKQARKTEREYKRAKSGERIEIGYDFDKHRKRTRTT